MINEIRNDIHRASRMVAEVEMIIGKREGETELVNKLIDAQNLLTYCKSRLENAIVPPCKVGDTVYFLDLKLLVIRKVEVTNITITSSSPRKCVLIGLTDGYWHGASDFGISLFYTREEAEKALAERSGNNE